MNTISLHGKAGIHTAAGRITVQLLHARTSIPATANNRPPRPSDARAAHLRKEVQAHRMSPVETLLTMNTADLDDGAPFSEVVAYLHDMIAALDAHAVATHRRTLDHPLPNLILRESVRETQWQGREDVEQMRLMEKPTCVSTLQSFVASATKRQQHTETLLRLCRQQIALGTTSAPRRFVGQRPIGAGR